MSKPLQVAGLVVLAMAAFSGSASANVGKANTCRENLTPIAQKMFDATAPHVKANSQVADLLREHVGGLVMSGKLTRADAQANAHPVGVCLKLLQS